MRPGPEILDTTLREGEQCYGVFFSRKDKKRIATLLGEIGVDFIEAGHPAAAPSIRDAVAEIANLRLRSRLIAHARLNKEEIRLVRDLGVPWVGLFSGVSDLSLRRYGLSRQAFYKRAGDAVVYAKELGLHIKFACEDASRADVKDVIDFFEHIQSLGADRLSYADTLGILTPRDVLNLCSALDGRFPFSRLHFHFHNDFGRAYENALTAIGCGAQCIDVSVLGLGERAGLVPLETILTYLAARGVYQKWSCGYPFEKLAEAVTLAARSINYGRYIHRRFAHKSGIHINGVLKDLAHYEPAEMEDRRGERLVVLSKLIGRSGLRMIFARNGVTISEEELSDVLARVKADEFLELADDREMMRYLREKRSAIHSSLYTI